MKKREENSGEEGLSARIAEHNAHSIRELSLSTPQHSTKLQQRSPRAGTEEQITQERIVQGRRE